MLLQNSLLFSWLSNCGGKNMLQRKNRQYLDSSVWVGLEKAALFDGTLNTF